MQKGKRRFPWSGEKHREQKIQRHRIKQAIAWLLLIGYIGLLFLTAPFAPSIWLWANEKTGRALAKILPLLGIGIFGVLYGMLLKRKSLRARKEIAFLTIIFICYAGLFSVVAKVPLEHVHLIEYSLLSVLVYLALSHYGQFGAIAGWGLVLVVIVGIADEMYQSYLPMRFFDGRDIFVNSFSGLLGFALVGLIMANSSDQKK